MIYSHIVKKNSIVVLSLFITGYVSGNNDSTINEILEDKIISLPYSTSSKKECTGAYSLVYGESLEKYPSNDLRNTLSGIAPGVYIQELSGDPGTSLMEKSGLYNASPKVRITSRGNELMYIIDDMPVDITTLQLNPEEIGSISIIRDVVGKAMYGPAAANGIIYIKTKKGLSNQKLLSVNVESGINVVDIMPGWVNGVEYVQMNNLTRQNSNLTPNYSDVDIEQYAKNDPYSLLYPNIDYSNLLFKNTLQTQKINLFSKGGNDVMQYFTYLGYVRNEDIYKIGPENNINKINARANIDIKVNNFISAHLNTFAGITNRTSPNYGSSISVSEFSEVINDITNIPPIAFPVYANSDPSLTRPWYAVSSNFSQNPIGSITEGGYYNELTRTGSTSLSLDFDLSFLLRGLKARSNVSYNMSTLTRIGKSKTYNAYTISRSLDIDGNLAPTLNFLRAATTQQEESKILDYYSQYFGFYQHFSYDRKFDNHKIKGLLTYTLSSNNMDLGLITPQYINMAAISANYSFKDRYIVQAGLNIAGTNTMPKQNRISYSPTIGLAWIISDEEYLNKFDVLNYLKLRGEAGILCYDSFINGYYFYDTFTKNSSGLAFGPNTGGNGWLGTNTEPNVYRTSLTKVANYDLRLEKRKEINVGFDASLFKNTFDVEFTYYNQLHDGIVSRASNLISMVYGINSYLPMTNYNQNRFYGFELLLQYRNQIGNFHYNVNASGTIQNSRVERLNQLNYDDVNRLKTGNSVDAIYGYKYLGFDMNIDENDPTLIDNTSKIIYEDVNKDGKIDVNDQVKIGHSEPKLFCALNFQLEYKGIEFFMSATGSYMYDIILNNKYFTNGLGDNTYSNFVKDNFDTPYLIPKYTAQSRTRQSSFWMVDGSFFKIQNAELGYNLPVKKLFGSKNEFKGIRLYARAANLFTFTQVKYVEPENINAGVTDYPLFRTFTGGITLTF
jgi:TonB-linked SusC/RagA family outer membrane protein